MFRKFPQLLKSFLRMLPTHLGARRQTINQTKADADAALTEFSNETTQFCLRRINRVVKT